jgi:[acyl-carrier-protein] S-malonyltransferase
MARLGILFPGQGAQYPGMGRPLWERFAVVRSVFAEASEVLDRDVRALCFDASEDVLRGTDVAQPALYVVGYAGWLALGEVLGDDLEVVVGAGHSLGEYTALAAARSYSFADGLRLVAERGRLMRRAGDDAAGAMVAIIGLDGESVEEVCANARARCGPPDVVVVANDNAPGQIVISGTSPAVDLAIQLARERGARRVVPLATSGAFHSRNSARRFAGSTAFVE